MRVILFFTFFSILNIAYGSSSERSCAVHGPDLYSYSGSIEKGKSYRFDLRGEETETHNLGVLINDCQKASGKFLMVGFGVNEFSLNASTFSTLYSADLDDLKCKIENSTLKNPMSNETRKELHQTKTNFLKACIKTTIAHNSAYPLKYREKQIGCTVEKVSPQRAIMHGGFCFFKIYKDSEFVVTHQIKDECLDQQFLNENNISLREVNAATTFGVAGSPTGTATDLELLPSKLFNFMLEPTAKHFPISEDWGRSIPQLPANYTVPEITFGDIKLRNLRHSALLKFPLLVDNNDCKEQCNNGVCTSSCNFSKPVVAEVIFSKIENGKKIYLKSWYDGSVAIPNWQGLLDMPAQNLNGILIEEKARYQIDLVFRDPKVDFTMYNKSITPLFMPLPGIPTMDFAASLLRGLPTLSSTKPISVIPIHSLLPDFGVIRDFGQYSGGNGVDGIQTLSKFRFWPQYFDNACINNKCAPIGSKEYMTLSLSFDADSLDSNGDFVLKNIIKTKKSRLEINTQEKLTALPKIVCPWNELE
ncbi:MAG: hypothetical protein KAG61_05675 [Bacteriovoracaceae bacterium]|nr:hypothetical protein [Bacteriovoracaceae bacterium]